MISYATMRARFKVRHRNTCAVRRLFFAALLWTSAICLSDAEEFGFVDSSGKQHSLADYKGQWVLVNFWATWCPPCLEEIPDFAELYATRKKDLVVFGIALDFEDKARVFEFAEKLGMNYPLVFGDDKVVAQFAKVNVLPTSFLFDPKGKKILRRVGPLTRAELEKLIGK